MFTVQRYEYYFISAILFAIICDYAVMDVSDNSQTTAVYQCVT